MSQVNKLQLYLDFLKYLKFYKVITHLICVQKVMQIHQEKFCAL